MLINKIEHVKFISLYIFSITVVHGRTSDTIYLRYECSRFRELPFIFHILLDIIGQTASVDANKKNRIYACIFSLYSYLLTYFIKSLSSVNSSFQK